MVGRVCLRFGKVASSRRSRRLSTRRPVVWRRRLAVRLDAPVTTRPQPTPTPPTGGAAASAPRCALGKGDLNAECSKTSSKLLGRRPRRHGPARAAEPAALRQDRRGWDRHRPVQGARPGGVPERPGRQPAAAGYCAQRDPTTQLRADPGQERERLLRELRRALELRPHAARRGSYFETCTPASFPVDRGDLPPAGSGCGYPYPAPVAKMICKVHLYGSDVYTLDSTALVGDAAYCSAGRLPGPRPVPGAARDSKERVPCESLARSATPRTRAGRGPTWTVGGQYCTGPASGCAEPPHEPARPARVQGRLVRGLRQLRGLLHGGSGAVTRVALASAMRASSPGRTLSESDVHAQSQE